MAQARVTDFFAHRRRGRGGPVDAAKQRGGGGRGPAGGGAASGSSEDGHEDLCSSSVREEFVRIIDEAAGLHGGQSPARSTADWTPSSPRTPKRTSADAAFDVGAAVCSVTAGHSTAKRRRRVEAGGEAGGAGPERAAMRSVRKKLALPEDSSQVVVHPPPSAVTPQPSAPAGPSSGQAAEKDVPCPQGGPVQKPRGPSSTVLKAHRWRAALLTGSTSSTPQALCPEDVAALKSRLLGIRHHAEELHSDASTPASSSHPAPNDTTPPVPKAATPPTFDAKALKATVACVKELAAKAQRRKEEREAEASWQAESHSSDSTEQPAYLRYHTLAEAAPPGLSLPLHYRVLADMFRSMDTVIAMLYNRCETATFAKLKQGVQDMMHKRFEESHVGQIKTVFPEAYTFRQERNVPTFNSSIKKGSYQLTVEPVIPSDQHESRPVLSASRLLERRRIFHQNLIFAVKLHHKAFLSSLVPPVSVPEDKLTRWHPRFNVDMVPAVQASSLPQVPHTEKTATAQEVLDKARQLITPKMEKALASLALRTEDKAAGCTEPASPQNPAGVHTSAAPTAPLPTALRGVSQSLLDKIRAKEAQKLQAAMTRNPIQEERLLMMSRLGELARILRNVFVAEKKAALKMEVACNRMVASYRSALSTGDMEKHVRLLAEVAADWLTIHPVRKDFYLKLNKNMELSVVLDKLSRRLREEERC